MTLRTRDAAIGILFLAAFLLYGVGTMWATRGAVGAGFVLMIGNSVAVLLIGVLMHPVIAPHAPGVAVLYLFTRVAEALLLGAGAVILLADAGGADGNGRNGFAYHAGMIVLGLGSLPFCRILIRQALVPRPLGWLGLIGYSIFVLGIAADAAGYSTTGMVLLVPGALFEIGFGLWLILRGFGDGQKYG